MKIELTGYEPLPVLPSATVYPALVLEGFRYRLIWSWVPTIRWRWPIRFNLVTL